MYSSVSEAEYQFRRAKAEQEARNARDRASDRGGSTSDRSPFPSHPTGVSSDRRESPEAREDSLPSASSAVRPSFFSGRLGALLSSVRDDDILILGLLLLLFNESKEDDPLILIILAVLLFT